MAIPIFSITSLKTITAQDLHRCDIYPADSSSLELAGISEFSAEVADVDLGLVHVAAPTRGVPETMR
jgi:hypothetical protein